MSAGLAAAGLAAAVLPSPSSLAVLALAGMAWRGRRAGMVAAGCLALLVVLAMPVVADTLLVGLERGLWPEAEAAAAGTVPGAIVVLGAEVEPDAARPGDADPGPLTLERLRAAAALARRTGLPLLAAGGVVREGAPPVAVVMARSLGEDFGLPTRWIEASSADTWQNAHAAAALLRPAQVGRVFVVTHAWHMARALIAFADAGLAAVPAPVRLDPWPQWRLGGLLPRASAWWTSYLALHEWIGRAAYAVRAQRWTARG